VNKLSAPALFSIESLGVKDADRVKDGDRVKDSRSGTDYIDGGK
jgi:hypothetical protein